MMGKEMLVFFVSLALGYGMCVLAKKQASTLKTLGYTLGIAMIVMTFVSALVASEVPCGPGKGMHGKSSGACCHMKKCPCGTMK